MKMEDIIPYQVSRNLEC